MCGGRGDRGRCRRWYGNWVRSGWFEGWGMISAGLGLRRRVGEVTTVRGRGLMVSVCNMVLWWS